MDKRNKLRNVKGLTCELPADSEPGIRPENNTPKLVEKLSQLEVNSEYKLALSDADLQDIEEIGAGNGGTVFKTLHKASGILMARKVILVHAKDTEKNQILRELQLLHDCNSPCIVSFYGAYFNEGIISVCMEFMDKGSLDRAYKKLGKLTEPVVAKIAVAILDGLHYIFTTHKIVHRDIKPSNILVNSKGEVKLCDFGVSGQLESSVLKTFVGTSWYMAPERIQGDDYKISSDTWSVGLSLMEVALGQFPFPPEMNEKKTSILELVTFIIKEPPPVLPETFSPQFQDFCKVCLDKNPVTRPTAGQLLTHEFIVQARADSKTDLVTWSQSIP